MKKIILSIMLVSVGLSYAQKKEINQAVKAADAGDFSTVTSQIAAAEAILQGKTYLLPPALLEQYYYAKGLGLFKSGKMEEGALWLGKIGELGQSKIYTGKIGKDKVYFLGKEAADKAGATGLKEETYNPTLATKLGQTLNPAIQEINKSAMDSYNAKNYAEAAPKFHQIDNLLKAAGQEDKVYLYYSAIAYALAKDNNNAIDIYKELIDSGYTGVETKYTALNKKTNKVEYFDKNSWELLKKTNSGDYSDYKTEVSKSVEQEIYETTLGLMVEAKRYDEAVTLAQKAEAKFPNNAKISELKGLAFFRAGKTEEFVKSLKESLEKNPNDKNAWYNLGVLTSKDPSKVEEAVGYFKKALELDLKFASAWQNLTFLTMGDDQKAIDSYNTLRKAGKIDEANKVIAERRKRLAAAIPYAEKWYEVEPNNIDVVGLLKGLYNSANNTAKAAEFKKKEEALKAANK